MKPSDLKPLDIVLTYNGEIQWVLTNFEGELMTFGTSLWGRHSISKYDSSFRYTGGKDLSKMSRGERQLYMKDNIVAVYRPEYDWKALHVMKLYTDAKRLNDEEMMDDALKQFKWTVVANVNEQIRDIIRSGGKYV